MRYRTGRTGRENARELDPYRVWYRAGALYVVGHDHLSGEVRTFAVGRIRTIEATERRFRVPESFDFDRFVGASFGVIAEPPVRVRIRFDKPWASWVAERTWHPSQKLERRPGGAIELAMEVGGAAEVRSWVLSFGSGAEVLEPEALREEVRAELAQAIRKYAGPPTA
jgi:predicted DNA-binding transcriptional regulator YafY